VSPYGYGSEDGTGIQIMSNCFVVCDDENNIVSQTPGHIQFGCTMKQTIGDSRPLTIYPVAYEINCSGPQNNVNIQHTFNGNATFSGTLTVNGVNVVSNIQDIDDSISELEKRIAELEAKLNT
jgi:hypothetical protein